jgi:hypothetical protein
MDTKHPLFLSELLNVSDEKEEYLIFYSLRMSSPFMFQGLFIGNSDNQEEI